MASALAGKSIAITRAVHQADEMAEALRDKGAVPLLYPCIAIELPEDTAELDSVLRQAANGYFDWLILTSANTVEALRQRVEDIGLSLEKQPTVAIGPATADAARDVLGVDVRLMPDEHIAEAVAEIVNPTPGMRILLPQANIVRPTLSNLLRESGADVTVVTAYRTVAGTEGVHLADLLAERNVDAVTFTSSSTVRHFLDRLAVEGAKQENLAGVCMACIGPKTADTARELGLPVDVVPESYTVVGLIDALENYFETLM